MIIAIWLQRIELQHQREELTLQREALEKQAQETKALVTLSSKQADIMANQIVIMELQIEQANVSEFKCLSAKPAERSSIKGMEILLVNTGAEAFSPRAKNQTDTRDGYRVRTFVELANGMEQYVKLFFPRYDPKENVPVRILFQYDNILGNTTNYICEYNPEKFKPEEFFKQKIRVAKSTYPSRVQLSRESYINDQESI